MIIAKAKNFPSTLIIVNVQRSPKAGPISIQSRTIPTIATSKRQALLDLGPETA